MRREFIMPPACSVMPVHAAPRSVAGARSISGRKAGFTLVEVVIAMALLILSLSAFLFSFVQSTRSAAIADNRLEKTHAVRQVMETLLSGAYLSSSLSNGYHPTNTSNITGVRYTVVTVTQTPGIIVKNVYLTNYWVNPLGSATSTVSLAGSIGEEMHP